MFAAIAAVVSAVVGLVSGIINSSAANLAALRQVNQANVDYARTKEITYYNAYQTLINTIGIILIGGLVLVGIIYYLNK